MQTERDKIAVEYKCMVPGQFKLPVSYKCPPMYVFQVLLGMYVTGAGILWLCFYSKQSMTIIECDFDEDFCNEILQALRDIFDKDNVVKTARLKQLKRQLQPKIHDYIEMFTRFLGEFPVVEAEVGTVNFCATPFNPYHVVGSSRTKEFHEVTDVTSACNNLWESHRKLIMDAVELLREEATEILAFVMTNSLRLHQENEIPNVPVAYALKGPSLPMDIARNMWNQVLEACHQRNCEVLCTVADGQFLPLANKNSQGRALTRLQLMRQSWSECGNMNKNKLLRLISSCEESPHFYPRHWVRTPHKPHIWIKHQQKLLNKAQTKAKSKPTSDYLAPHELLLLLEGTRHGRKLKASQSTTTIATPSMALVDYEVNSTSETDSDSDSSEDPDYNLLDHSTSSCDSSIQNLPDVSSELDISNLSDDDELSDQVHLHPCLHSILKVLQSKGRNDRWTHVTIHQLANEKLGSPAQIRKLFVYELEMIRDQLKEHFGKTIFSKNTPKQLKYQNTIKVFCPMFTSSQDTMAQNSLRVKGFPKLSALCKKQLLSPKYPKEFLQIVACQITHHENVKRWENDCPIDLQVHVPGTNFVHELFCYPEWNDNLQQFQFITMDPSHCLTNLRAQISRHSFKGVSRQAFLAVSEMDNNLLSKAVVEDILDKQSVDLSLRFFSRDVQNALDKLGFKSESHFVSLVRHWYESADARGIKPEVRFQHFQNLFDYLEAKIDYSDYPPPSQYIDGIPIRTFECLMHIISTRFALLSHCRKGYYVQRSISSLGIENWFSELSRSNFTTLGCPKSCDVPRLIAKLVEINAVKHDPHRGFHFSTQKKTVYPYHLMETNISEASSDENEANIHPRTTVETWFDKPRVRSKSRKKSHKIAGLREIEKGVQPIRQHYKIDESQIPLHKRAPFNVDYDSIKNCI